jgi:hypothetical protein
MKKNDYQTVDAIRIIESRGPWQSKSGGELDVLFGFDQEEVRAFLDFANPEFDRVQLESGEDIRGLRSYSVSNIPKDSIGAQEWHRARTEYVRALSGSALWTCVDFEGNERTFTLDAKTAVIIPPEILHTYQALEDNTRLQVICNTLFNPDNKLTHDSYSQESFYEELSARKIA